MSSLENHNSIGRVKKWRLNFGFVSGFHQRGGAVSIVIIMIILITIIICIIITIIIIIIIISMIIIIIIIIVIIIIINIIIYMGVQRMGVVLYSKLVYNIVQITTPCFHCTPLCRM